MLNAVPDIVRSLVQSADNVGAGAMVLDSDNRIVSINSRARAIYPFMDFGFNPTYEELFWACVDQKLLLDAEAYSDPASWLAGAHRFRTKHAFAQYIVRHSNNHLYLARHQTIQGVGSISYRLDISDKLINKFSPLSPSSALQLEPAEQWVSSTVLDSANFATGIVSTEAVLIDANKQFMEILSRGDGIQILNGHLTAVVRGETVKFHEIIRKTENMTSNVNEIIKITKRDRHSCYFVSIRPLLEEKWATGLPLFASAAITVTDPDEPVCLRPETLMNLFDLTKAEAQIAIMVFRGLTVAEIAESNKTTQGTVRNQLKSIFLKTNISKQADLVRRIAGIANLMKVSTVET